MKTDRIATASLAAMFLLITAIGGATANAAIRPLSSQAKSAVDSMTQGSRRIFFGNIGGKYDIRAYLWREGETFSGYYLYETIGGNISLEGAINANGNFVLKESDFEGKETGVFKGKLTRAASGAESTLHLEGTWSKPDGSGAMPFSLDEQRFDLGPGIKIATKSTS